MWFYHFVFFFLIHLTPARSLTFADASGNIILQSPHGLSAIRSGGVSPCVQESKNQFGTNCLYHEDFCTNVKGQCGILEFEANAMCGNWADCGGMICGVGSGAPDGYCLARGKIDKNKTSQDSWALRKKQKIETKKNDEIKQNEPFLSSEQHETFVKTCIDDNISVNSLVHNTPFAAYNTCAKALSLVDCSFKNNQKAIKDICCVSCPEANYQAKCVDRNDWIKLASRGTMFSSITTCSRAVSFGGCTLDHNGLRIEDACCKTCGGPFLSKSQEVVKETLRSPQCVDHDEYIREATSHTILKSIQTCVKALQTVDCTFCSGKYCIKEACCASCRNGGQKEPPAIVLSETHLEVAAGATSKDVCSVDHDDWLARATKGKPLISFITSCVQVLALPQVDCDFHFKNGFRIHDVCCASCPPSQPILEEQPLMLSEIRAREISACVENVDHDKKILIATKNTMYSSIQSCAQALQYVDCSFQHFGLRIRDYCCKSCGQNAQSNQASAAVLSSKATSPDIDNPSATVSSSTQKQPLGKLILQFLQNPYGITCIILSFILLMTFLALYYTYRRYSGFPASYSMYEDLVDEIGMDTRAC